jgi:hypothetical protein
MVMKPTRLSGPIASVMFGMKRPGPPHVPLLFLRSNLCAKSGFFLFDLLAQPLKRPNLLD